MHVHIGHSFFGTGNLGDDLVIAGFLRGIEPRAAEIRLTAVCRSGLQSQRLRFPGIDWQPYSRSSQVALIEACDAWLGLGGSVLQQSNDGWLLPDQLSQLAICRRAKKPITFLGCGIDYRADSDRPEIRTLLDSADWIWARDTCSADSLRRMKFSRVSVASDLSHLCLADLRIEPIERDVTGFILNFEQPQHYSRTSIEALVLQALGSGGQARWLVQEVRKLHGSEEYLWRQIPWMRRHRIDIRRPDYGCAAPLALIHSWGRPERLFSTRYHGAIVGAWLGSRVVLFAREPKIKAIAYEFSLQCFNTLPEPEVLLSAFTRAVPVSASMLERASQRAQAACTEFVTALLSNDLARR